MVALGAFAVAQAVLFRLYLPHRYTYPLVAFFAIAVGVGLRPAWAALRPRAPARAARRCCSRAGRRRRRPLRLPARAAAPGRGARRTGRARRRWRARRRRAPCGDRAGGAPACGSAGALRAPLLVAILAATRWPRGTRCPTRAATRYLATLPKDAVVAGDPIDLKCLPATARRAVVISTQLAPSYEADDFRAGRARMFAMLRAYYGPLARRDRDAAHALRRDALWVRRAAIRKELRPGGARWRGRELPYGRFVRSLLAAGRRPCCACPRAACAGSRAPTRSTTSRAWLAAERPRDPHAQRGRDRVAVADGHAAHEPQRGRRAAARGRRPAGVRAAAIEDCAIASASA